MEVVAVVGVLVVLIVVRVLMVVLLQNSHRLLCPMDDSVGCVGSGRVIIPGRHGGGSDLGIIGYKPGSEIRNHALSVILP